MSVRSKCPNCGQEYDNFSTNLTFKEVRDMMWVNDQDSTQWRHKRRKSVLGYWHELKLAMWREHLEMCGEVIEEDLQWVAEY
jgi:hypothetical protein